MARFWVGGGSTSNWNATSNTNWAASSGGAGNQTVPDNTQDVTFDGAGATGNSASVVSANITILSLTFSSGYTQSVTINNNVVITISGNFTDNTAHSWTASNATSGITINATSTINSGGKTFPGAVILTGASTKTLSTNDWTVSGNVTVNTNANTINSRILNCGANLTFANIPTAGTTKFVMNGTGTLSGGTCPNSLDLAGTVTLGATMNFITGTLRFVSGSVNSSGGTLTLTGSCTIDTSGMTWTAVTVSAASTITFNSLFLCTTFVLSSGAMTFAGSFGFTVGTFNCNQATGITITFANTITYTITTAFNCFAANILSSTGVAQLTITSDHATNKAILTLQSGATCSVMASATRIDSSAGRTINAFHGTLTSTTNWFSYTDYGGGVSSSYVWA